MSKTANNATEGNLLIDAENFCRREHLHFRLTSFGLKVGRVNLYANGTVNCDPGGAESGRREAVGGLAGFKLTLTRMKIWFPADPSVVRHAAPAPKPVRQRSAPDVSLMKQAHDAACGLVFLTAERARREGRKDHVLIARAERQRHERLIFDQLVKGSV